MDGDLQELAQGDLLYPDGVGAHLCGEDQQYVFHPINGIWVYLAVITLYSLNVLRFSEQQTIVFFSVQSAVCGLLFLCGSVLSDGYLGMYKTMLCSKIVWLAGKLVLVYTSSLKTQSALHPWFDFIGFGLVLVAIGGQLPAWTPFGASQIDPRQKRMLSAFISVHYMAMSVADVAGILIMPYLRCGESC